MSEGPAVPVEDVDDAPAPVDTPAPVAATPEAVVPAADETPAEVDAVEVAGKKYVPTGALIAERKGRQAAEQKAARVDQLEQYVAQSQPYIEFLKNNPQLLQPRQPEAVTAPAPPTEDPEAIEAAKLMDFYTPEGKADAERGARWLALQDRRSQRVAQAAVQPYAQSSAQQQSNTNFQRALMVKDAAGETPNEQILRNLWGQMTAEQTANPAVAGLLVAQAIGLQRMYGKQAIPPPAQTPVVTEASGGQVRPAPKMSDLEATVASARKMTPQKWAETTKNFRAGRPNVLEDD